MTLYLSRLRLTREPSVQALSAVLKPRDDGARTDTNHRRIWSAFADAPDRKRDFLWREEVQGMFTVLSHRPPGSSPFFDSADVKPVSPDLHAGDRLRFVLRANATRTIKASETAPNGKRRRKHVDIVMDALCHVPKEDRADQRLQKAHEAAQIWLTVQGERHGFSIDDCGVEHYGVRALPGHHRARKTQPQFGILDLTGVITVSDPQAFLSKWASGFGRARAFGCGLMLIRRA